MRKIAIVGNIASGKSEVKNILLQKNYKILDTDEVTHKLLENNAEIITAFKDFDITENGQISRKKLGNIVFNNENMRHKLESILHPQIRAEIKEFFAQNSTEQTLFVEIPLLFEANMQNLFDDIVFIYTNDEIRLQRLIARNGYTKEYALKRMNAQISQDEKVKKSSIIIKNNSSIDELKSEISKYF